MKFKNRILKTIYGKIKEEKECRIRQNLEEYFSDT